MVYACSNTDLQEGWENTVLGASELIGFSHVCSMNIWILVGCEVWVHGTPAQQVIGFHPLSRVSDL